MHRTNRGSCYLSYSCILENMEYKILEIPIDTSKKKQKNCILKNSFKSITITQKDIPSGPPSHFSSSSPPRHSFFPSQRFAHFFVSLHRKHSRDKEINYISKKS